MRWRDRRDRRNNGAFCGVRFTYSDGHQENPGLLDHQPNRFHDHDVRGRSFCSRRFPLAGAWIPERFPIPVNGQRASGSQVITRGTIRPMVISVATATVYIGALIFACLPAADSLLRPLRSDVDRPSNAPGQVRFLDHRAGHGFFYRHVPLPRNRLAFSSIAVSGSIVRPQLFSFSHVLIVLGGRQYCLVSSLGSGPGLLIFWPRPWDGQAPSPRQISPSLLLPFLAAAVGWIAYVLHRARGSVLRKPAWRRACMCFF